MGIIDLQRGLAEVGRIRLGEKVQASNGRQRPAKLDRFRFTSKSRRAIEAAADAYGGTVEEWRDAPSDAEQWQVKIEAADLAVLLPPSDLAWDQWYELWNSAGVCIRRCDGRTDHRTGNECECNPEERDCTAHTRLSLMLTELRGIGLWRVESSGYYAARELKGAVEILSMAAARGQLVPARLRLDHRERRSIDPQTDQLRVFKFVVPVLDIDASLEQLGIVAGRQPAAEIGGTPVGEIGRPGFTPVSDQPALESAPVPSVAEQVAAVDDLPPARRRTAPEIPTTGVEPRPATDVGPPPKPPTVRPSVGREAPTADGHLSVASAAQILDVPKARVLRHARSIATDQGIAPPRGPEDELPASVLAALGIDTAETATAEPDEPVRDDEPEDRRRRHRHLMALARECWSKEDGYDDDTRADLRHALIYIATSERTTSANDLTDDEQRKVVLWLKDLREGHFTLEHGGQEIRVLKGDERVTIPLEQIRGGD